MESLYLKPLPLHFFRMFPVKADSKDQFALLTFTSLPNETGLERQYTCTFLAEERLAGERHHLCFY